MAAASTIMAVAAVVGAVAAVGGTAYSVHSTEEAKADAKHKETRQKQHAANLKNEMEEKQRRTDATAAADSERARMKARQRSLQGQAGGRQGTILTGPQGLAGGGASAGGMGSGMGEGGGKTLLGA